MSVATEITRLINAKADIKSAIETKGVTVGDGLIDTYAEKIREITVGGGGDGSYDQGYEDGYNKAESTNPFYYIDKMNFAFANKVFANGDYVCKVQNVIEWSSAFIYTSGIKTLKIICDTQGNTVNYQALVRDCADLELLDLTELVQNPNNISYFAYHDYKLKTILGALNLSKCTNTTNAFAQCSALENIEFVPNTIQVSLTVGGCPNLTHDSLMSIINGLAVVETTQTLTLGTTNLAKLTDEEKAIATEKGWSLA